MAEEYTIYSILYRNIVGEKSGAVVSAESDKEAISLLETSLEEKRGINVGLLLSKMIVLETEFRTSKKGIVFGYDSFIEVVNSNPDRKF